MWTIRSTCIANVRWMDFINAGVTKEFLKREYQRAKEGVVTPNCRQGCSGCGCRVYEGGVCYEA